MAGVGINHPGNVHHWEPNALTVEDFQSVRRQRQSIREVQGPVHEHFLVDVDSVQQGKQQWTVDVKLDGQPMTFKIDNGADVDVVTHSQ